MKNSNEKSKPVPVLTPMEEQMSMLVLQQLQLERTIWLLVREAGVAVVVDEGSLNPLWDVRYERVNVDKKPSSLLKVTASQLPEASDGQIQKLAQLLDGQPEERTPSALREVGLSSYPPSYVVARLAPIIQCADGRWKRV